MMPVLQDKLGLRPVVGSSHSLVGLTCLLDGLQGLKCHLQATAACALHPGWLTHWWAT